MSEDNQKATILDIQNLSVAFNEEVGIVKAVQKMNLQIKQGEIVAIVGESGSGKTVSSKTILKMLGENSYSEGKVLLFDKRESKIIDIGTISNKDAHEIRGLDASMIYQEPTNVLNPVYTIGWQFAEGFKAHQSTNLNEQGKPLSNKEIRTKSIEILKSVGIPDAEKRIDYYPHEFSGGQKQRIVIGMALALGTKLIIADEPTTALDVTVQQEILDLLKSVRDNYGISILLITHNMGVVADMADKVLVMENSKLVETNNVYDLFANPQEPYTKKLLSAVPKISPEHRRSNNRTTPIDKNAEPIVKVKNLYITYPGHFGKKDFVAVNDVSFQILPNETLGLVGESGSGKTTIGRGLVGLSGDRSGDIILFGQKLEGFKGKKLKELYRKIGFVFQDLSTSLNPRLTVGECIAEPVLVSKLYKSYKDSVPRIKELIDSVKLPSNYIDRFPHELSGGERQRISLARALSMNPQLIIADEPTSALDVTIQAQVLDLFLELQDRYKFACLFISHDLAVIDKMCDYIAVLHNGKIVEHGTGGQVLDNPQDEYTKKLLASLPIPDPVLQRQKKS